MAAARGRNHRLSTGLRMQKEVYHGEMVTMYPTPSKHSLLIASVFFMSSDKQGAELDSGLAV